MILRSVLHMNLLGAPVYYDNETVRSLISDERQRRVTRQCLRRCAQISISEVWCVKHDVRWKRLDLSGPRIEVTNVTRQHVSNARPTWRNVLSRTESFGDFSVDFRHWFALPKQFADTQELWEDCSRSFGIEANRLPIKWMVAIDYAGETVCAIPHF